MAIWNEPKSNYVASDEVTPQIFNELAENEKYLKETQDTKITSSEVKEATINNTQSSTRTNLTTTEKLKTGFGKIRKWFADLEALAFKDTVGNSDITDIAASKVSGLHTVATSGSYNDLNNKPPISKEAIGLGEVANERQYSALSPPPYPLTKVQNRTGDVVISKDDIGLSDVENERQYSMANPPPYPISSVNGKTGIVNLTKTDIGLGNVDNIKQYSSSNPPPYPVVTNGSYPNMTVGNSNKLGNRPASDYLTTDSDIPQGVTINTIKINKTMYSTDSGTQSYDLTGAMTTDEFNPSKDIFYVTAHAGNSSNFWGDMGGGLSYRRGPYSLIAYLNSCWQNVGNMNATVRRSEVTFNESTKKFRATIYPAYRFSGGSSYSPAQQIADTQVIVDLYIIKFR